MGLARNFSEVILSDFLLGGDMASTWIAKPEVHAEVQITS
jgi:hypothetical protein